jgi:hypothetical protein
MKTFDVGSLLKLRANDTLGVNRAVKSIFNFCLECTREKEVRPIEKLMQDMLPLLRTMLLTDPATPRYYLDTAVILAPLSITVPIADYVAGRGTYRDAVRFYLEKAGEPPERIDSLLRGL